MNELNTVVTAILSRIDRSVLSQRLNDNALAVAIGKFIDFVVDTDGLFDAESVLGEFLGTPITCPGDRHRLTVAYASFYNIPEYISYLNMMRNRKKKITKQFLSGYVLQVLDYASRQDKPDCSTILRAAKLGIELSDDDAGLALEDSRDPANDYLRMLEE